MTGQPTSWRTTTHSVEQTLALAATIAQHLRPGDVIALVGELGAGKTQFVRGLTQGLGAVAATVASPTFVMVHEYETVPGRPPLVHIDAYRLRSLEDLESIGWTFHAGDAGRDFRRDAIVAIEWADRLDGLLGEHILELSFAHMGEHDRLITITPHGRWLGRAKPLFDTLVQT